MELPDTLVDPSVEHVEIPDEVIDSVKDAPEPVSREQLEQNVSAGMKSVFEDEEAGNDVSTTVEPDAADEKANTESADETPDAVDETPVVVKSPTIPAAQARSLKAYGYTDEEIAESAKDPSFKIVAAKLHAQRNKELADFANAGRQARQAAQQTPNTSTADTGILPPVDVAGLKKEFGEDKLIEKLAGPLNQAIDRINKATAAAQASQKTSHQAELETVGRQIESFFTSKDLAAYKPVFGSAKDGFQGDQLENRSKVLEFADALIEHAKRTGRQLSLDDAMQDAFNSVSSGFKEQAVRTTIKKQMKQRERGITLKPGSSSKAVDGKIRSKADLEKKVKAGLSSVFAKA